MVRTTYKSSLFDIEIQAQITYSLILYSAVTSSKVSKQVNPWKFLKETSTKLNSINPILSFLYKKFTVKKWSHAKIENPDESIKLSRDRTGAIAHWLEVPAVKSRGPDLRSLVSLVSTWNQAHACWVGVVEDGWQHAGPWSSIKVNWCHSRTECTGKHGNLRRSSPHCHTGWCTRGDSGTHRALSLNWNSSLTTKLFLTYCDIRDL